VESYITGMPGFQSAVAAVPRTIFLNPNFTVSLARGKVIDGTNASDPDNSPDVNVLRAGLLMGKITATGKYGASVIGVTQGALAGAGTSITLTPAQAAELVRRVGPTGNLVLTGPPAAAGTVAQQVTAYTAVVAATGVVTIAASAAAFVAGSLVGANDGTSVPIALINSDTDPYGILVTLNDNQTRIDVPYPNLPITGEIVTGNIVNYPADASLKAWIRAGLSSLPGGKYVFDDYF
jgi:hypothetical protein